MADRAIDIPNETLEKGSETLTNNNGLGNLSLGDMQNLNSSARSVSNAGDVMAQFPDAETLLGDMDSPKGNSNADTKTTNSLNQ